MMPTDEVIELNLGIIPEAAVSGAISVQTERSTFLTFNAMRRDSSGRYEVAGTALVEFKGCLQTKFGYPNDEAWSGIPRTAGLSYGIFEVRNSSWLKEIRHQNSFSFPSLTSWSSSCRHFLCLFHDSSFECLADSFSLETVKCPYSEIFRRIEQRVLAE